MKGSHLQVHLGVVVGVNQNHGVGFDKVQTHTTRTSAEKERKRVPFFVTRRRRICVPTESSNGVPPGSQPPERHIMVQVEH